MIGEQTLIGIMTAALCVVGLRCEQWLLAKTSKGAWLVTKLGHHRAAWALRAVLWIGIIFGTLLAMGIINPLLWERSQVSGSSWGERGRASIHRYAIDRG